MKLKLIIGWVLAFIVLSVAAYVYVTLGDGNEWQVIGIALIISAYSFIDKFQEEDKDDHLPKVKVINKSPHPLPTYAKLGDAGLDLRANFDKKDGMTEVRSLEPGHTIIIPTGIYVKLPRGYEFQIRPRSGLAAKFGITVLNSPGTIDSEYTGEIKILLHNTSEDIFWVEDGERICQIVLSKVEQCQWEPVKTLASTLRGENGFGHTGIK